MKYLFSILAFQILLFSTQPIWQAACERLLSECCMPVCAAESTCKASGGNGDEEGPIPQCCPPFQCCFISFPGFSTPYLLEMKEPLFERKTRPQATVKKLKSSYLSDCFHPPEREVCTQ